MNCLTLVFVFLLSASFSQSIDGIWKNEQTVSSLQLIEQIALSSKSSSTYESRSISINGAKKKYFQVFGSSVVSGNLIRLSPDTSISLDSSTNSWQRTTGIIGQSQTWTIDSLSNTSLTLSKISGISLTYKKISDFSFPNIRINPFPSSIFRAKGLTQWGLSPNYYLANGKIMPGKNRIPKIGILLTVEK